MSDNPFSTGVQTLVGLGVKPEVATGALNYMYRNESRLDPNIVNPTSGAHGYAQWLGPRKEALFAQYGPNPTGEQQWQFMTSELQGPERATLAKLQAATGEKQGYDIWGQTYERPGAAALSKAGAYPEGYYGGALHVNISKERRLDDASDSLLSQMLLNSMAPRIRGEEKKGEGGLALEAEPQPPTEQPPQQQAQAEPQQQELIQPPPSQPSPQLGTAEMPPLQPLPQAGGPLPPPLEISPPPSAVPQQPQQPQQQARGAEDILKNLIRQAIPGTGQAPQQEAAASPISSDPLLSRILRTISPIGTAQAAERPIDPLLPRATPELGGAAATGARTPVTPSSVGVQQPAQPPLTTQSIGPQPQLPPMPAGGASGIQSQVEGMQTGGAGGMHPGPAVPTEPPREAPTGTTRPQLGPGSVVTPVMPGGVGAPPVQPPGAAPPGRQPPGPPPTPPPGAPKPAPQAKPTTWERFKANVNEAIRDVQLKFAPMAAGEARGQRIAKDFANAERVMRYFRTADDRALQKFPEAEQKAMWEAMDSASVAAQTSGYNEGARIIARLPKAQQDAIWRMENRGVELWERARAEGMVEPSAERLPFYVPRAIVDLDLTPGHMGVPRPGTQPGSVPPGTRNLDQPGVNISTRGVQSRAHLTAEETEAAARARLGGNAQLVRNIRTLPYYYERLEKAIIGRRMINELRQVGLATGKPTVLEGNEGAGNPEYFTLPHPAFYTSKPRMTTDPVGNKTPLLDEHGNMVFDRVPLYVSKQFEGPLRAIARGADSILYRGAMHLKAGSISLIMNSPMIHNAVVWGKALPGMPGKMVTFRYYTQGEKWLNDRVLMEQAISDGLVPMGSRGYMQDIHGIAEEPLPRPGQTMPSRAAGSLVETVAGQQAGEATKRGWDKASEFYHYNLLWKQVAKVQMGLYQDLRAHYIKKGIAPEAAGPMAARAANNYVGAIPNEAMSQIARKLLNVSLFSRSFTMSNISTMKDAVTGLPRDLRAQLGRDLTTLEARAAKNTALRKAIAVVASDIALYYFTNAAIESGLNVLKGDKTLDEEGRGYVDRMHKLATKAKEHPLDMVNIFEDLLALTPQSEHEPERQNRILIGHQKDGTAIYARNPIGKIGEELIGWMTTPIQQLINKEGTIVRPLNNLWNNDRGFGEAVYNKHRKGIGDTAVALGNVLYEFLRTQVPEEQVKAALNIMQGKGDALQTGKLLAPAVGFSMSRGAPGGEAVGEMYAAKAEARDRWKAVLPEAKKLVEAGKIGEARQKLRDEKMPNHLIRYYMRIYQDPKRRMSPRQLREFNRSASPEAIERMQRHRGVQPPVQSPSFPWLPSPP